jgi:hypothetical protein
MDSGEWLFFMCIQFSLFGCIIYACFKRSENIKKIIIHVYFQSFLF